MARDIEVDAKVNDKSKAGLDSFARNVKKTGKDSEKEFDRFGKSAGESILKGIGAVSPKLASSIASGIGDAASLGAPLLIAGIGASLPIISGLVGAAVSGAAGGVGIIGGALLAARDPRVKQAGATLASNLLATLQQKATPFIEPLLGVIDEVGERFTENGEKIDQLFANTSKLLPPLAHTLLDLGENLLDGINIAAGRAGPVFQGLENGIDAVGDSFKSFFDDVSENAEFNGRVLEDTLKTIAFTVEETGKSLKFLGDIFGTLDKVIPLNPLARYSEILDSTKAKVSDTVVGQFQLAQSTAGASSAFETSEEDAKLYNKALEDNAKAAENAAQAERSLFDDTTKVGEAFDNARDAARKNGKTLSENTDKGRDNRKALSDLANALNTYRGDLAKSGAAASTVNGTLVTQRKRFYDVALSMTGSSKKAQELTNKLLGIPSPKPKVTLNTSNVASQARNAREEIASIKGKTVTVTVNVNASRLASVEKRLAKIDSYGYAGPGSFGITADGQGSNRVGGVRELNATLTNQIFLDGEPFYQYTDRAMAREQRRVAFRQKVGRRN